MENVLYYMAFSHCLGIGPMRFKALMQQFGGVQKAYEATEKKLTEVIGVLTTQKFIRFRTSFDPVRQLEIIRKKEITVVPLSSSDYPVFLRNISDPPICLYVKGDIKGLSQLEQEYPFAIVGTRKPTSYGVYLARKFSHDLATAGFVIVSGLALGIDAIAHTTALEVKAKTIAILGCGVDIVYPPSNRRIYEGMIQSGGTIVSEFPPGHTVMKGLFVARNRLISGISKGVLVIEGAIDSGALITARYALEQGRDVFAPPSPITSQMAPAPNLLLKQGAIVVTETEDIFRAFNLTPVLQKKREIEKLLTDQEKIIFQIIQDGPIPTNELVIRSKLSITEVLRVLSSLEIKEIISENSEGYYQLRE